MKQLLDQEMKQAELRKVDAEIANLIATAAKLNAETEKLSRETRWYPILIVTGMFAAIGAVLAAIVKFL